MVHPRHTGGTTGGSVNMVPDLDGQTAGQQRGARQPRSM
jgi:hypothetical protein